MVITSRDPHLASRLRLAVARTARRLRQEAGGGLSKTLTAAPASIENHGPLTPSELADRERIKRPTATRLIGTLEGAGLVARTADIADRRSSLIAITPEGRERLRTLSDSDRETLARAADLLERLLEEDPA